MKDTLPNKVTVTEVGMRDGFQFEEKPIPIELKLEVLGHLIDAGLKRIQVTSFVHPKWVPQMADAEEICRRLPDDPTLTLTALALNVRGVERAREAGVKTIGFIDFNERTA